MNFDDTPDEAIFREEVRAWLLENAELLKKGEFGSSVEEDKMGNSEKFIENSKAWQAKKHDAGWACISWPKEYGGRNAKGMQSVIWKQEEARFNVPANIFQCSIGMTGPVLMAHGTDEQKARFIPRIARGEDVYCQLFSEPGAGSDLAGLRTKAVRDGDDWVVNGQKIWTSLAQQSDFAILVTRTDFDVPKHKGLTYFIVDLNTPGIEICPIKQMPGSGGGFNEVFLTDVRIPDKNRIGAVGDGWKVTLTTLANERSSIAGGGAGKISIGALIKMASKLSDDSGPLIQQGGIKERIADLFMRSRGLRYTSLRGLSALSQGRRAGPEGSIGKLGAASMRQEMAAFAIELQGLAGAIQDPEFGAFGETWQDGYLRSPMARLAGGTDEIQRDIIAEKVLGLPREPRVDKTASFRDLPTGK